MKIISEGNWIIEAVEDSDGHLTVAIRNDDGSKVIETDEDLSADDVELTYRFTTEKIEADFKLDINNSIKAIS